MLSKGKGKRHLSDDQVNRPDSAVLTMLTNYQAKYVTQAITAYIAITIKAIFTVSPTCSELNSFMPKIF